MVATFFSISRGTLIALICYVLVLLASCEDAKIVIITAIFGSYERSAKAVHHQFLPTDWVCFTNNPNLTAKGWDVDMTPYHYLYPSPLDTGHLKNSLHKDSTDNHFHIAKYYKQSFHKIPRLQKYDIVIWIDGSIEIEWDNCTLWTYDTMFSRNQKIITWNHELRHGSLRGEVDASYNPNWVLDGQALEFVRLKNYSGVHEQYADYLNEGFNDYYWQSVRGRVNNTSPHFGVWITCWVAFNMKDPSIPNFLDSWYNQTLVYTPQDQVSFPFVVQKLDIVPYTLPDNDIWGPKPHAFTKMYWKWGHGNRRKILDIRNDTLRLDSAESISTMNNAARI